MKKRQKIITLTQSIPEKSSNLDEITKQLNDQGWEVKQIVSTTATREVAGNKFSKLIITLPVESDSPA